MRRSSLVQLAMVMVVLLFLAVNFFAFQAADKSSSCFNPRSSSLVQPSRPAMPIPQIGILPALWWVDQMERSGRNSQRSLSWKD